MTKIKFPDSRPWLIDALLPAFEVHLLGGPSGSGKCLAKGTPVLMFDGSVKPAEQILVGDLLMGPDSRPRTVRALGTGRDEMFTVTPKKGESFTVNGAHILALHVGKQKRSRARYEEVSVVEYLEKSRTFKNRSRLYRTGVEFENHPLIAMDPYFLGLWLGDGDSRDPVITTADSEIVEYLYEFARKQNLKVGRCEAPGGCPRFHIGLGKAGYGYQKGKNPIRAFLRASGVQNNKHIPPDFLRNSRSVRLALLAGLLDSDGSLQNNCFDFISKHQQLAKDFVFLVRSLGLAAYLSPTKKKCVNNGCWGAYWRVSVSGDTHLIPTKIVRKQATCRKQIKNVLRTGFSIVPKGQGEYFGFEIDGDGLFLLGDFTVTHNTRWLFDLIETWQRGDPLFGFASHPVPYVYCAADRSYASVCDTLRDIGMDPATTPVLPALDLEKDGGYSISWLMSLVKSEFPAARLILLEGIGTFVPGGKTNDYYVVSKFLRDLSRACRKAQVTIWGVHHTSKEKGKEGAYENSREKLLGSAAWSAFAESIFMLDLIKAGNAADPYRRLSVFPRNKTAGFVVNYKFGAAGRLIQVNPSEVPAETTRSRPRSDEMLKRIREFADRKLPGSFQIKELLSALSDQPERTIFRVVGEMVLRGFLCKMETGVYRAVSMKQFEGILLP